MKPSLRLLALSTIVFPLAGCGLKGLNFNQGSGTPATISVSPTPASVAAGSTVTFTATVSANAKTNASWLLRNFAYVPAEADLGTLAAPVGNTVVYTAPATTPIYTAGSYLTPGTVTIDAQVPDPGTFNFAVDEFSFVITTPSITAGISPTTANVTLGATLPVFAYAVGSINNAITLQVAGVTGGAAATGTIAPASNLYGVYAYTAPTTMPMTGATETITVVSSADPTKTATLTVTLQNPPST